MAYGIRLNSGGSSAPATLTNTTGFGLIEE